MERREAYETLKTFFDNGFSYFQTLVRMFIFIAAPIYCSLLFGAVAGAVGLVIIATVLAYDRGIIAVNKEINGRENELLEHSALFQELWERVEQ